jgi:hypothetical protein
LTLKLELRRVDNVLGIYEVDGVDGRMPARMRWLHPDAAKAFAVIAPWAVVSDMFRSPESSLNAIRTKVGAKPPGFSAHNFGLAVDLDIAASRQNLAARVGSRRAITKAELDEALEAAGWFCHRRDHAMDHEAWHFNYLGVVTQVSARYRTTEGWIEGRIRQLYGAALELDDRGAQSALKRLRLYSGAIDGKVGPLTREATRVFQRAWGLVETGRLDARTQRTLAYVAADRPDA